MYVVFIQSFFFFNIWRVKFETYILALEICRIILKCLIQPFEVVKGVHLKSPFFSNMHDIIMFHKQIKYERLSFMLGEQFPTVGSVISTFPSERGV